MKAEKANVVVVGSEAFTKAFKIIGVKDVIEVEKIGEPVVKEIKSKIKELIENNIRVVFIVENKFLNIVQDLVEETKYSVYPIFISLPGPQEVKTHDPKSYYLNKIKGVLGISIEI